jgi:hypothetical protein
VSGLYEGVAGTFKNIYFSADIDFEKGVVAMVQRPNGTTEELRHCGFKGRIGDKKHNKQLDKPIYVKRKKGLNFAVEFVCLGAHHQYFEPQSVYLEAHLRGTSEKVQSEPFIVIGSRDDKDIKAYAKRNTKPASSATTQTTNSQTPEQILPQQSILPQISEEELFALFQSSADPSNQARAETSVQDLSQFPLDDDPYKDFTCSRFDN